MSDGASTTVAIEPTSAHLRGSDSQRFTSDVPVKWIISPDIGKLPPATEPSYACVYTAPPKLQVWFSRQIVLRAIDENNKDVGSATITLDSAPSWIFVLTILYLSLFFFLVVRVVAVWPPAPAVPSVEVTPPTVTTAPGLTQQFDASVWHERDQSVTWSATDGLITPTGLFTAPASTGGRVVITATSNANKNLTRSALVIINSPGLAVQPTLVSVGPNEPQSFKVVQTTNAGTPSAENATAKSAFEWLQSDNVLKMNPNADGTDLEVQAPSKLGSINRVVLTVHDKAHPTLQASAVVYLSRDQASVAQNLVQEELNRDKGLLVLVMLMGALGALLGASRSLGNFVGNNAFVPRWTLFYMFRPTFGAGLALLVFVGYRIGAITGVKGAAPADPFAATFIAGMVGLFADTVLQKLKDVITALFPSQDERKDKVVAPTAAVPTIESVQLSDANKKMTVKGKNFVSGAKVTINGEDRATTFVSAGELTVALNAADTGDVKVVVINPDKHSSTEFTTKIGT